MQLSQKQNTFSQFSLAFLKSSLNFEHFQKKKMTLIAYAFPKLRAPKNVLRSISKKSQSRVPFEKHDRKRAQILLKLQRQHPYHIC